MSDIVEPEWLVANRALWDDLAVLHEESDFYDLPGHAAGKQDGLRPWEDAELGSIDGLDLVHLQCHIGTDTVSLARRAARVVGLDFSGESIAAARRLGHASGLDIEWAQSDVYEADVALTGRSFDVVYTGMGALGWLPHLRPWAQVVRSLLRPGGFLYVTELHPLWQTVTEDGKTICQDAIDADYACYDEDGSYVDRDAHLDHTISFERLHSTSDLLTAVLDAGLRIELFHEFDVTPAPTAWLERRDDGLYHFPDGAYRFPVAYSLLARLPLDAL